jgi:hypothetical protein
MMLLTLFVLLFDSKHIWLPTKTRTFEAREKAHGLDHLLIALYFVLRLLLLNTMLLVEPNSD